MLNSLRIHMGKYNLILYDMTKYIDFIHPLNIWKERIREALFPYPDAKQSGNLNLTEKLKRNGHGYLWQARFPANFRQQSVDRLTVGHSTANRISHRLRVSHDALVSLKSIISCTPLFSSFLMLVETAFHWLICRVFELCLPTRNGRSFSALL